MISKAVIRKTSFVPSPTPRGLKSKCLPSTVGVGRQPPIFSPRRATKWRKLARSALVPTLVNRISSMAKCVNRTKGLCWNHNIYLHLLHLNWALLSGANPPMRALVTARPTILWWVMSVEPQVGQRGFRISCAFAVCVFAYFDFMFTTSSFRFASVSSFSFIMRNNSSLSGAL